MKLKLIGMILAACFSFFAVNVQATILGYDSCLGANDCLVATGADIPNPILPNPNDGILLGWNELQNVTLSENLYINRVADPSADFIGFDATGYYIKAGTIVSSHYFQWDPGFQSASTVNARIHFDSDIFAFITSDQFLFNSDAIVGLPGFDYADFGLRGLESGDTTNFAPGGDNSLVDISWAASSPGDWTRLITAYSPQAAEEATRVSEPGLLGLWLVASIGLLAYRRRRSA